MQFRNRCPISESRGHQCRRNHLHRPDSQTVSELRDTVRPSMRIRSCLIGVALLVAPDVQAQTTSDGVQALVRGDYQTAARILQPLADGAAQPDAIAQFFMAILYYSGQGVPRNAVRACALYLSAATSPNPLSLQALDLARLIQVEYGPVDAQLCASASASSSAWREAPTASFELAADLSVSIDQTAVTVTYKGTVNRAAMLMGGPGFVFLPIRFTQLDVSQPIRARRHFVEFFIWQPDTLSNPTAWTLGWILFEVIGPDFRPVTGDKSVMTITALQPPASFDANAAAHVAVNATGEAEWIVSGGPNPRSAVVPFKGPQ